MKVEWDGSRPLTPFGPSVYFIEFLKVSGVFDALIADCPLHYTSPNAPEVRDVIGTWVLSALAGHRRYAHVTALRSDTVLPELMGMSRIVSEDSLRRALAAIPLEQGLAWLQRHLDACVLPLLGERISSISIQRSSFFTGIRKAPLSATIPKSRGAPPMFTIPICWRASAW